MRQPETDATELMRPAEVGEQLRLSRATIYRLVADGVLPAVYVGERRATRIRRRDVVAYIERNTGRAEVAS